MQLISIHDVSLNTNNCAGRQGDYISTPTKLPSTHSAVIHNNVHKYEIQHVTGTPHPQQDNIYRVATIDAVGVATVNDIQIIQHNNNDNHNISTTHVPSHTYPDTKRIRVDNTNNTADLMSDIELSSQSP